MDAVQIRCYEFVKPLSLGSIYRMSKSSTVPKADDNNRPRAVPRPTERVIDNNGLPSCIWRIVCFYAVSYPSRVGYCRRSVDMMLIAIQTIPG